MDCHHVFRTVSCYTSLLATLLVAPALQAQTITATVTTGDQVQPLTQTSLAFSAGNASAYTIVVDPSTSYQTMDGFGASLTDSSAWLISNKLSVTQRNWLMQLLFSPSSGIGLDLLRQPMGASDFSASGNYSYDDMPAGQTDPSLLRFSIAHDTQYIIPLLLQAQSYNSNLKIHALPWSPPAWMKTSGSMNGGQINPSAAAPLANYFVKFIQAYQAYGLPIYAVSAQNEPENANTSYPTAQVQASDEANFIADYLGPALVANSLNTKIFGYEHNWSDTTYPTTLLANSAAYPYLAGTSFHCYGGNPTAQSTVKNAYPGKDIWFTECTGSGNSAFGNDLKWEASNLLIGATRNWARGITLWNLALDQNHGPGNGGCANCRGLVTIDTSVSPATITANAEFYVLAHLARFVMPGAVRIYSNTFGSGSVEDVAFRNPDGSSVLFVLNGSNASQTFTTYWQGGNFNYQLPASSVVTFNWPAGTPTGSGFTTSAWYNILSQNSFSCVDGQTGGNGQPVQQWQCGSAQYNQEWQLQAVGGAYYKVLNRSTGRVWDVTGGPLATANGTGIQQWSYAGGSNQQWQPVALGNGYYQFIARSSGKCLDAGGSTQNGIAMIQNTCSSARSQRFFLTQQP
jgi:glucosylceramidase